jgi:hypothetical protein
VQWTTSRKTNHPPQPQMETPTPTKPWSSSFAASSSNQWNPAYRRSPPYRRDQKANQSRQRDRNLEDHAVLVRRCACEKSRRRRPRSNFISCGFWTYCYWDLPTAFAVRFASLWLSFLRPKLICSNIRVTPNRVLGQFEYRRMAVPKQAWRSTK